jgi:L1 cell adhesion molecule like protein
MSKLGLSMSHPQTLKMVRLLGENHDQPVLEWKQRAETMTESMEESRTIATAYHSPVSSDKAESGGSSESEADESAITSTGETTSDPASEQLNSDAESPSSLVSTYVVVSDNIDKTINPRHMTIDRQRQSLHYMHMYAALDRVSCATFESSSRLGDVMCLTTCAFLPTVEDSKQLYANYATLLARLVVEKMPYFSIFKDCVVSHIPHRYTEEMQQKSSVVPLGIIPRNETKNEDMVEILKHLHRYVPTVASGDSELLQIGFAGDQLTAARARQAIDARVNSKGQFEALCGLVPYSSDWHAKVNFLSVSVISSYVCSDYPNYALTRSYGKDSTRLGQARKEGLFFS